MRLVHCRSLLLSRAFPTMKYPATRVTFRLLTYVLADNPLREVVKLLKYLFFDVKTGGAQPIM